MFLHKQKENFYFIYDKNKISKVNKNFIRLKKNRIYKIAQCFYINTEAILSIFIKKGKYLKQ
ncbi:hypothetical protein A0H76_1605 [Hepatospora eriocheir]|uniref:Uncharacterized protein n=1 Tax=Hepatospora eriocheir TaxID=1081669 RepID=A0A1X0QGS7_9MICR|nr:hypothetical protein A0H76_1605 [Hepatospora eriocheir]